MFQKILMYPQNQFFLRFLKNLKNRKNLMSPKIHLLQLLLLG
jgi:hypothetical protein